MTTEAADSIAENFGCIVDLGGTPRDWAAALEQAEGGRDSRTLAQKGKALVNLGRFAEAQAALDAALAGDPACAWAGFFRAAALFGQGDAAAAEAQLLKTAGGAGDEASAAAAFRGLLLAARGAHAEALATFDPVVAGRAGESWPYALRAGVRKGAGDLIGAGADLDQALQLGASAWIHLERVRVLEEQGDLNAALRHADAAVALKPDAESYARRAHIQLCRRHYPQAAADYGRVIEADPSRVDARLGRARVQTMRGHAAEALADQRLAEKAFPGDLSLRLERIRLEILNGETAGPKAELTALRQEVPDFEARLAFEAGCCLMKEKRWAEAAAEFDASCRAAGGAQAAGKAAFYRTAARMLEPRPGEPPPKIPDLVICGLGMYPPFTATRDTLRAISACDMVFNNLSDPEVGELVQLLVPRWKPTAFDILGAGEWTKAIFNEMRPGSTVGFVTRGHPLVCGGLAANLISQSHRVGTTYRIYGSVSSMDVLSQEASAGAAAVLPGNQVIEYSTAIRRPFSLDPYLPAVVYYSATVLDLPREGYDEFCASLEAAYGAGHECLYFGRRFDVAPERMPLSGLRAKYGQIDPAHTVVIPPL